MSMSGCRVDGGVGGDLLLFPREINGQRQGSHLIATLLLLITFT